MRRVVIGTAGHVDHGKTTLVQALTGVDTDRLVEEKRRGITIELGFAPWALDEDTVASVVDVPGHRRFVHTMIAGASGIEAVLLVVAADEGVMPQTREHLHVCELLGIRCGVVAVTKIDRVERELAELAAAEISEEIGARLAHEVVLVSAKTREGLDDLAAAMRRLVRSLDAPSGDAAVATASVAVDRSFPIQGAGSVVTGTLARGALDVGAKIFVARPDGTVDASVRGLHVHGRAVTRVEAPTRVAINVAGISVDEAPRGSVVTTDPHVGATRTFDATVTLLRPVKSGATVEVYVGTARAPGRLMILRDGEGSVLARLKLAAPLVVRGGDRFVLRGSAQRGSGSVIGGGRVLDASPPRGRRSARRVAVLAALASEAEGRLPAIVSALAAEAAPKGLFVADFGARFPLDRGALARACERVADTGSIVRLRGDGPKNGYVDRAAVQVLAGVAVEETRAHHLAHPHDRGIALETLRQRLAARAGPLVADEAIRFAAKKTEGATALLVESDTARLASFGGAAAPVGPTADLVSALRAAGLKGMAEFAVTELLKKPVKEVRAILARVVRDGDAISAGEQWFARPSIDALRDQVIAHFKSHDVLTIAQFKELSGLGRKQAIPLLELFEREGVTLRRGDDRFPGPRARG
ncbi:MAG: selenocysteine-specific translation elongation factor [Polyangiaceae bacterium]